MKSLILLLTSFLFACSVSAQEIEDNKKFPGWYKSKRTTVLLYLPSEQIEGAIDVKFLVPSIQLMFEETQGSEMNDPGKVYLRAYASLQVRVVGGFSAETQTDFYYRSGKVNLVEGTANDAVHDGEATTIKSLNLSVTVEGSLYELAMYDVVVYPRPDSTEEQVQSDKKAENKLLDYKLHSRILEESQFGNIDQISQVLWAGKAIPFDQVNARTINRLESTRSRNMPRG